MSERRHFLTPERIEMRFTTLLDAFLTADRRRRGYLNIDQVIQVYSLYFNSAAAKLEDSELIAFVERHLLPPQSDGSRIVDYMALAEGLRQRDQAIMREHSQSGDGAEGSAPSLVRLPAEQASRHRVTASHTKTSPPAAQNELSDHPMPSKQSAPPAQPTDSSRAAPIGLRVHVQDGGELRSPPLPSFKLRGQFSPTGLSPIAVGQQERGDEYDGNPSANSPLRLLLAALEESDPSRCGWRWLDVVYMQD